MNMMTRATSFLNSVAVGIRAFVGTVVGVVVLCGFVTSVAAEAPPPKKKDPIFDENRIHKISVFSYMQSRGGSGPSRPVLVTLKVKGPEALVKFCDNQPSVSEAVLDVLSRDRGKVAKKAALKSVKSPLRKAINRVLKGKPVRKVDARAGRSPAEFGPDLMKTKRACRAIRG